MTADARAALERELAAADRESDDLRFRLDSLRQVVTRDVDRGWTSPWKSPDTFDAKVRARLAGHQEYQALRKRQRELDERRRTLRHALEKGTVS